MGKFKDLTGQKFGRLTVIERVGISKNRSTMWRCKCDCGSFCVVSIRDLKSGNTRSCGCLSRENSLKFKNLTGLRFGKLTVVERAENKGSQTCWRCKCDCGNVCVVAGGKLTSKHTKSCGCLHGQNHGLTGTKIYKTWSNIKRRCFNTKHKSYKNYGGRGITMFAEWIHDFQAFYDYVSKLPHFDEKGYTLDRIDNNGDYCPDNVRWATKKEQNRNKSTNVVVEYQGKLMTLAEASEKSNVQSGTLRLRFKRGDTGERLFRPVKK